MPETFANTTGNRTDAHAWRVLCFVAILLVATAANATENGGSSTRWG